MPLVALLSIELEARFANVMRATVVRNKMPSSQPGSWILESSPSRRWSSFWSQSKDKMADTLPSATAGDHLTASRLQTPPSTLTSKGYLSLVRPKTFQDAIFCARQFGIRWVWIDTLCIIQDDETDWIRESARMGSVYANAYLTISAAASTDDSSGIFPSVDDRMDDLIPFLASDSHSHGGPGPPSPAPCIH